MRRELLDQESRICRYSWWGEVWAEMGGAALVLKGIEAKVQKERMREKKDTEWARGWRGLCLLPLGAGACAPGFLHLGHFPLCFV